MCTRQLTITNPHYKKLAEDFNVSIKCFAGQEDFILHVPCGHCDECLKKRQQQWFLRANHVMKRLKLRPEQCLFCTFSIRPEVYEQTKEKPYLAIRRFMDRLRKHPRFREKGPSGRYRYRKVRFPYIFVVEFADGLKRRSSPAKIRVNETGTILPGARVVGETCERFTFDFLFLRRVKNIMPIIKNNKSVVVE